MNKEKIQIKNIIPIDMSIISEKLKELDLKDKELDLQSCSASLKEGWIFQSVLSAVQPKNILEIGFYRGGSSFLMLNLSEAKVTSVDPIFNITDVRMGKDIADEKTLHAKEFECVDKIKNEFGERFSFIKKSSTDIYEDVKDQSFDFMYMDGDHWEHGVRNDFNLALKLKIPYILVDDWIQPQNSPKSIPTVWGEEFSDKLKPLALFYREATCNGFNIPMILLKNNTI